MSEPLSILSLPEEVMVYTEQDRAEYGEIKRAESEQIRYNEVMRLHSEGVCIEKIAKIMGISNLKVGYWIRFGFEQGTAKIAEYGRKWRVANPDKVKEQKEANKRWRLNNPEKVKEQRRKQYLKDKEKAREQKRLYRLNKQEKIKEQRRLQALKNAEKAKERKLDREKSKEQQRLWRLDNPEKVKEARKMIGWKQQGIDPEKTLQLYSSTNICEICGKNISANGKNPDHDHKTHQLRGILCKNCNMAIGLLKDNTNTIQRAINYLKKYEGCEV